MACNLYYAFTMLGEPVENPVLPLKETIARIEIMHILEALESADWVQTRAADRLGISQRVLGYKIKKYKITIKPKQRRRER